MRKSKIPPPRMSMVTRLAKKRSSENPCSQNTKKSPNNKTVKNARNSKKKQKPVRVADSHCSKTTKNTNMAGSNISEQLDKLDHKSSSPNNISIHLEENSPMATESKCVGPEVPRKSKRVVNKPQRYTCETDNNMKVFSSKTSDKEHRSDKLVNKHSLNSISKTLRNPKVPRKKNSKLSKPQKLPKQTNGTVFKSPSNQKTLDSYFSKADKNMITPNIKISANKHRFDKLIMKQSSIKYQSCISPSAKLEGKVPKIDDILRTKEASEQYIQLKRMVEASAENFLKENNVKRLIDDPNSIKPIKKKIVKNCKHLSLSDIKEHFEKDVQFLDNIIFDKVYNERHELFKQDTSENNCFKNDLRVNETTCMFTEEQLIHIVSLFRERYDKGNIYKNSNFYFKVLLPEYCLKIFMKCHKMTPKASMEYLKSTSVSNYFKFFE